MRRWSFLVLLVMSAGASVAAEPPAALRPFEFLLGRWIGIGDQAGATGGFSFALDVQDRVITRTNYSDTPAGPNRPASRHDDLMVIYVEGASAKADYFDSEGHVIRYAVDATPKTVVFVSETKAGEPRYRLTYRRGASAGTLDGSFEVAPPDKPDAFAPYLSWRAKKAK